MPNNSGVIEEKKLSEVVIPTTLIDAPALSEQVGIAITLATESFQKTGSFKFRAAYNLASQVPQQKILAASSGNFGQALAYACKLLGKQCIVVMPAASAAVKIEAVRSHGAMVDLTDTRIKGRAQRLAELAAEHPDAYVASPYDDDFVIQGNSTLGTELAKALRPWKTVIAPIGGGGLISGIAKGLRSAGSTVEIIGAEPALANDASRSLRAGRIIENEFEAPTIADGARTISLGKRNWEIIRCEVRDIVEVSEANIAKALRLLFRFANLKVEPTGALSLGAVLERKDRFGKGPVCCVVSGGNVDPQLYARLLVEDNAGHQNGT
jgi:threonine dehydratase